MLIENYKGWKIYPNYNENNEPEWFIVGSRGQLVDVEDRADAINYIDGVEIKPLAIKRVTDTATGRALADLHAKQQHGEISMDDYLRESAMVRARLSIVR